MRIIQKHQNNKNNGIKKNQTLGFRVLPCWFSSRSPQFVVISSVWWLHLAPFLLLWKPQKSFSLFLLSLYIFLPFLLSLELSGGTKIMGLGWCFSDVIREGLGSDGELMGGLSITLSHTFNAKSWKDKIGIFLSFLKPFFEMISFPFLA